MYAASHAAFPVIYCMESSADVVKSAKPVSISEQRLLSLITSLSLNNGGPLYNGLFFLFFFLFQCLQLYAPFVKWETIESCARGEVGHSLMHQNAVKTQALKPAHTHVPWITINGVRPSRAEHLHCACVCHVEIKDANMLGLSFDI